MPPFSLPFCRMPIKNIFKGNAFYTYFSFKILREQTQKLPEPFCVKYNRGTKKKEDSSMSKKLSVGDFLYDNDDNKYAVIFSSEDDVVLCLCNGSRSQLTLEKLSAESVFSRMPELPCLCSRHGPQDLTMKQTHSSGNAPYDLSCT